MQEPTSSATTVPEDDTDYRDETITKVTERAGGWEITDTGGWLSWVPREHGVEPHVGDAVRFYGRGIGWPIRGLRIRNEVVFYRSAGAAS